MSDQKKYDELCKIARDTSYVKSTLALLEWDQQTKLPARGGNFRAEQITFLAGELHRHKTNPRTGDLLNELAGSSLVADPHSDSGSTIREHKREYEKQIKLPARLVEEQARAHANGQQVWVEARKKNDYKLFAPHIKNIFKLKREQAEAVGYEECAYDALLDDYEPYAKTSEVAAVLEGLRKELVPLVAAIADSNEVPQGEIVRRNFPKEAQNVFGKEASAKIGFDYDRGRLDVTHHPFCTELGPDDVRITTRYDESFFNSAFFGTLHEAGHGMYEQGLRGELYGLPPGSYCSLGIHESQSRMWENLVGRSRGFWTHFFPRAQELFHSSLADVSADQFYRAVNEVRPSLIRVEADQATYDLHIIIRFELEQAILEGQLDTDHLPGAWNEKYQSFLGITPPDDASGCLQDIHWSAGLVGYFATYSLGNLYASQMFDAAEKELGDLQESFTRGEFISLKEWLNRNVHQPGQRFPSPELGRRVTGQELSHTALINHLNNKLAPVYAL